jgi:hypothetical protein
VFSGRPKHVEEPSIASEPRANVLDGVTPFHQKLLGYGERPYLIDPALKGTSVVRMAGVEVDGGDAPVPMPWPSD